MKEETLRLFIAIPTPPSLRQRLQELETVLQTLHLDAKWVLPERIHLTLKFLGETPLSLVKNLQESLEKISHDQNPFSFWVDRYGAFPNLRRPRILWAGSEQTCPELQRLVQSLEVVVSHFGFQKEGRAFSPHLTLGRLRSPKHCDRLEEWVKEHPLSWREEFLCGRLVLFQSTLTPKGPIYKPLYEVNLKKS